MKIKKQRQSAVKLSNSNSSPLATNPDDNLLSLNDFKHAPYVYKESELEAGKPLKDQI